MQARLWAGVAGCVAVAVASGWCEHRRRHRRDLDRVGTVPWSTLQFAALFGALLLASVALSS